MKKLKILFVEDLPTDVEIAQRALNKENINFRHLTVETKAEFEKALKEFQPDLIISDYAMPKFDGMTALKITRSQPNYIPFIMLTGSMNEETAVACMKAGADDYVIKEKIRRLPFAVQEVLHMDLVKKEKEQALQNLRRSEQKYHLLISSLTEGLMQVDNEDRILYVNQALCDMFGYSEEELLGKIGYDTLIYEEDKNLILARNKARLEIPEEKYEIRGKKKNGEIIWLSISGSALKDEQGRVIGSVGLLTDITERKQAQAQLHLQSLLLNQIQDRVTMTDLNGVITYINDAELRSLGYSRDELIGATTEKYGENPEQGARQREIIEMTLKHGKWRGEVVNKTIEGKEVILDCRTQVVLDEQGTKVALAGISTDITERKQAEEMINERIKELKCLQTISEAIEGGESLERILHTVADALSSAFLYSDIACARIFFGEQCYKTENFLETEWRLSSDIKVQDQNVGVAEVFYLEERPARDEGPFLKEEKNLINLSTERLAVIIERKQAEEEIQTQKAYLERLFESAPEAIVFLDNEDKVQKINPEFTKLFGYTTEEVLGKKINKLVVPEELKKEGSEATKAVLKGHSIELETIRQHKNGKKIFVSILGSPIKLKGKQLGVYGIYRDITERKQTEHDIIASETRYRRLFESAKDGILILDAETGMVVDVNPFLIEMLGYSHEQFIGKKVWELGPLQDIIPNRENFLELQQHQYIRYEDMPLEATDGKLIHVEFVSNVYLVDGQKVIQCNIRDITERKQAESALSESERQFAFLAGTAFDLVKFTSIEHIYEYTARKLYELMEDQGIVAIAEYDTDSNLWKMKNIEGIYDKLDDLAKIFGFDIHQLEGEISTRYYEKIISGKLEEIEFDFPGLFNNKISDKIGKTVKKLLSIDKMYCIAFQESEKILGNITLVTKKNANPLKADLIEAFILQVTNFIKKQKSDEALRQNEEKLQSIFRVVPTGIGVVNNRILIEVNPRVCEMTGYSSEELISQSSRILYPSQEEFEFVGKEKYAQIARHGTGMVETRWQRKDGTVLDILLASTAIDSQDLSQGVIFTALDITERKQAAEALKASEIKFRTLVDQASEMLFLHDLNGKMIEVNETAIESTGYSREELAEMNVLDIDPDAHDRDDMHKYWLSIKPEDPPVSFEGRHRRKNGSIYSAEITISKVEYLGNQYILGLARDITERKQAEAELRKKEFEKSAILDSMLNAFVLFESVFDEKGDFVSYRFLNINRSYEEITGVKLDEVRGKTVHEVWPGTEPEWIKRYGEVAVTGKSQQFELYHDPTKKLYRCQAYRPFSNNTKFCVIFEDITERKKAEERLQESEEKFRFIAENSIDCIWQMDLKLKFTYISPSIFKMFGFTQEEWIGSRLSQHCTLKEFFNMSRKALKAAKHYTEYDHMTFEAEMLKKDGTSIPVEIIGKLLFNEKGLPSGFQGSTRDITERKQAEIRQTTLFNISEALNKTLSITVLCNKIREHLGKVIDTTNFYVALYNQESDTISLPYNVDIKDKFEKFPAGKTLTKYVIQTAKPLFAQRAELDELTQKGIIDSIGTPSEVWLGVPLIVENQVIGVIALQDYENADTYSKEDIRLLTFVSEEIALAIKRTQAEEQIRKELAQKNTLLQELYHRTKNNMQVITSMLRMQSRKYELDREAESDEIMFLKSTFQEIINRINAMSLVHQKLYQSDDLSQINLKDYIADLTRQISRTYSITSSRISLKYEMEDVFVLIDSAIPLGLVLNELISNAFKHAFPNERKGIITLGLHQEEGGRINIRVLDNGAGPPLDLDLRKNGSMGLETMFTLMEYQLKGTVKYKVDNGLKWDISFNDDLSKKRV